MDVLFFRQRARLARWRNRPYWPAAERGPAAGCARDAYERTVAHEPPGEPLAGGPHRRAARAILGYDIFPPRTVRRVIGREPVERGDAVGAEVRLVPGVRLFFASRVIEVFDRPRGGVWQVEAREFRERRSSQSWGAGSPRACRHRGSSRLDPRSRTA